MERSQAFAVAVFVAVLDMRVSDFSSSGFALGFWEPCDLREETVSNDESSSSSSENGSGPSSLSLLAQSDFFFSASDSRLNPLPSGLLTILSTVLMGFRIVSKGFSTAGLSGFFASLVLDAIC